MAQLVSAGCCARRDRFRQLVAEANLDAALIVDVRDIYYFTGTLLPADLPAALIIERDGRATVVGPDEFAVADIDAHRPYEWHHRGTKHPDPVARLIRELDWPRRCASWQRIGIQAAGLVHELYEAIAGVASTKRQPIDDDLATMQRRKDADELDVIRASVAANMAAYDAVAAAIAPGLTELAVLSAGRQGATLQAGEKLFHDGDYQCGGYNGPARNRAIERGELYIVDAWTCFRGYWCDMARTYVVGAPPTDVQQMLFDHIGWVLREAGKLLRPGTDGTDVYRAMDDMVRQHPALKERGLIHHGGHAIGLRIHEMPDINLARGGQLEAGQVICLEPGGYFSAARFGVRLENMFLVTPAGGENLCPGTIELRPCG
jgi:Xaa-Pro aminopeptidase